MSDKPDHSKDHIQAFKDEESHKRWLFGCIGLFLAIDAAFFLAMLACAFRLASQQPEAWHIFIAPALAGGIGTIVGIFMIKAVFGMGGADKERDFLPTYETAKEIGQDLSE